MPFVEFVTTVGGFPLQKHKRRSPSDTRVHILAELEIKAANTIFFNFLFIFSFLQMASGIIALSKIQQCLSWT